MSADLPRQPDAPASEGTADARDPDVRGALSALPQVDAVVRHAALAELVDRLGAPVVTGAVRAAIGNARDRIREGGQGADAAEVADAVRRRLGRRDAESLVPVINATGVVLHTNLGRAPLSQAARDAVGATAGYTTLEFDRSSGGRGSRTRHLGSLVAELAGTQAGTVVNNGAGALVLVLAALAQGREVVVSRGELVEIGGSYRLPDIMAATGVRLVEVGTTNRTRLSDYEAAITDDTALLLKVHRSNFALVGFTEEVGPAALADLAARTGVPLVHDLGSGLVREERHGPLAVEPSIEASVRAGVDVLVVSGDKLLGGPQAGLIAGRSDLVARLTAHPFARALRVDKLQRAALEATIAAHLREARPLEVPVVAMLHADPDLLRQRAVWLASELGGGAVAVAVEGQVGGGSLPGVSLPSWAVAVPAAAPQELAVALRACDPPVIGRVDGEHLLLDVRTVPPAQDVELRDLVLAARG